MPGSNITKRVLAQTFKELVCRESFEKVSVSDICDACQVSRKTFYYHFQDKYALMEWIFETEFVNVMRDDPVQDRWAIIDALCQYLYRERKYYGKLMQFQGQNSFRRYFHDFLFSFVERFITLEPDVIREIAGNGSITPEETQAFYSRFLADAVLIAVFRWLSEGTQIPAGEFVGLLRRTDDLIRLRASKPAEEPPEEETVTG